MTRESRILHPGKRELHQNVTNTVNNLFNMPVNSCPETHIEIKGGGVNTYFSFFWFSKFKNMFSNDYWFNLETI